MVINPQSVKVPSATAPDLETKVSTSTTRGIIDGHGPCFVYNPISNPSPNGPTHTLNWEKTRNCSRGWSEERILSYMREYGQPTEITVQPTYPE